MRPILFALAFSVLALNAVRAAETVHLRRYERIETYRYLPVQWGDKAYTYMDTADTTLNARHPNDNFGASRTLRLSPGQRNVLLIQFGQLNRAIGRG